MYLADQFKKSSLVGERKEMQYLLSIYCIIESLTCFLVFFSMILPHRSLDPKKREIGMMEIVL